MATCPSCKSSRLRTGYRPVALPLRLLGFRELLCDDCNLLYRAFSPFPPRSPRKRQSGRKANTLIPPSNSAERTRTAESPILKPKARIYPHSNRLHTASERPPFVFTAVLKMLGVEPGDSGSASFSRGPGNGLTCAMDAANPSLRSKN